MKHRGLYYFRQLVRHGANVVEDLRRPLSLESRQAALLAEIGQIKSRVEETMPDNPLLCGFKVYSQVDEDGIIHELLRRLPTQVRNHAAIEIGCGAGIENNTHFLMLNGFRAVWIDGDAQNITQIRRELALEGAAGHRLGVEHRFIDLDNIEEVIQKASEFLGCSDPDFFSLDIDGNDLHVLAKALESFAPKLICTEYNAKFPPPVNLSVRYNRRHVWAGDDYHGASLQAFCDLLSDYSLVCCNISGANAFFVRNDLSIHYTLYPAKSVYMPFRSRFQFLSSGHPPSLKWLRDALHAGRD